ncbi:MAG: WxL domain-containing protein [Solirubrobacteraceae bacterium]|nr:WxL domain-containing protein [Patulibacter sp.]
MTPSPLKRAARWAVALSLAATVLPAAASAATSAASETITGGSLAFINSTPAAVTFPGTTLNGTDQTATQTQALDISDARGTGAGWNVTATSTAFTNGAASLANGSTTVLTAPSVACDASVTCVTPTNSITYPYTLPAAATAPTATKLYNAATNTGTGAATVTPTWKLAVPATAAVGTYTSTWTFSLVSGP